MTTPKLKVLADPLHAGRHPLHDSRYIVTADAEPGEIRTDDDGDQSWTLERGSIIATMTDCQHQAKYAQLFAAAPELREALGRLVNEAKHYLASGRGRPFLMDAIREADLILDATPKLPTE